MKGIANDLGRSSQGGPFLCAREMTRRMLIREFRAGRLEIVAPEEFGGFARFKGPTAEGLVKGFLAGEGDFAFSVAVVLQETDGSRFY